MCACDHMPHMTKSELVMYIFFSDQKYVFLNEKRKMYDEKELMAKTNLGQTRLNHVSESTSYLKCTSKSGQFRRYFLYGMKKGAILKN